MFSNYFNKSNSAAPLAVFRIALGVMLLISITRFWYNGWIYDLYISPRYFFPFFGFSFIVPLGSWTYLLFAVCAVSALLVALGLYYRLAITSLFLSFTYIELIDKTTYLNHYYFVSMICLLMIFLPAHVFFSIDAYRNKTLRATDIPQWCIDALKLFVCILYFYAGMSKINSDWLLEALPLRIWLPARNDMPVIGFLFNYTWVAYAFSWFGCIYDLAIPFLLWNKITRIWGYIAVVVFHILTSLLFPIGMFPYVMIVTALIFFPSALHHKILGLISRIVLFRNTQTDDSAVHTWQYSTLGKQLIIPAFAFFFVFQLLFPWRFLLYPGALFWTEQGYRFSWRVMLMEKAGYTQFTIKDASGKQLVVNNNDFLTPLQEKMMSTQPDMILQYAHILRDYYTRQGFVSPQIYVDSYVALNGHRGKPLVKPDINLVEETDSFKHKSWIVQYND